MLDGRYMDAGVQGGVGEEEKSPPSGLRDILGVQESKVGAGGHDHVP